MKPYTISNALLVGNKIALSCHKIYIWYYRTSGIDIFTLIKEIQISNSKSKIFLKNAKRKKKSITLF